MAVKTFRDYTGSGLREAKDFVDFYGDYIKYS